MISIVLLHNSEEDRLNYLRPKLLNIQSALNCKLIEISDQSLLQVSFLMPILRKIQYYTFARGLQKHRLAVPASIKNEFRDFFFFLRNYILSNTFRRSSKKNLQIEDVLTRKHIEALEYFVRVGNLDDHLVVIESDAVIESESYFISALNLLPRFPGNYVIFGAHYEDNELGLTSSNHSSRLGDEMSIFQYDCATSNTTVAYGLNYDLAKRLLVANSEINSKFKLAADFWFNALFMKIAIRDKKKLEETVYFKPSPVLNGSLLGTYSSSFKKGF